MRFGAHLSVSKGLPGLLDRSETIGGAAIQIFARNPRGRGETKIPDDEAKKFRQQMAERDWKLFIHAPYYVNVGSGEPRNQRIAIEMAAADLEKGDFLGADGVVVHLGTPGDNATIEECTAHTISTVGEILKNTDTSCRLLLETSAGLKKVGSDFGQLAEILKGIGHPERVGVCFDTCHVFVSGYDVRESGMKKTLDEFDRTVGLDRVSLFHCNDTESTLGSGWDRHFHIGRGSIGEGAFTGLLKDKRLKDQSFVLETPKEEKGTGYEDPDTENILVLKRLAA